jgi:uncharacterized protein
VTIGARRKKVFMYPRNFVKVHGKILSSGAPYDNRFISVITIENREIVHWRDYMDSLAAWSALNGSS